MNSFSPQQVIKSAELNANFTGLADGTEILDDAITPPKISNPYKFSAYRSASYSGSSGATVQLNAEAYDLNSNFDTSTYTYTIPVTGYYRFSWRVGHSTTAGIGYYSQIMVNGSAVARGSSHIAGYTNASAWGGTSGSQAFYLTAGDAVTLYWVGSTNTIAGDANGVYTFFTGELIP